MPISSLGGFSGQAGRDDRPVAKGDGHRVRSGLAAGGRWIRTSSTAAREPIAILRRACPTHARLGAKDGQRGAHPYVFYRLGVDWSSPENRVHDEATDLEF